MIREPYYEEVLQVVPGLSARIQELQRDAGMRLTIRDFPAAEIARLANWEQDTELSDSDQLRCYVGLACGCLTTAFVMSQRHAAVRRLQTSDNPLARNVWLPEIRSGRQFATVGISHLTTSRRHLLVPPVRMVRDSDGWRVTGVIPWVTGASHADLLVAGAIEWESEQANGNSNSSEEQPSGSYPSTVDRQYLLLVPMPHPGIEAGPGMPLVALTCSCTDVVRLDNVMIPDEFVLHGPHENVMAASQGGGAGGLQTSALALGLAAAAIDFLAIESKHRPELGAPSSQLQQTWRELVNQLLVQPSVSPNDLRKQANDLALQSTQAALAAAKGAGFVEGHPVGRWCREALFFLVWSCPQPVANAHLCSFSAFPEF